MREGRISCSSKSFRTSNYCLVLVFIFVGQAESFLDLDARLTLTLPSCLDARFPNDTPLSPSQKRAHVTLLIQAGADTTGTALGVTLRFLLQNPSSLARCVQEIRTAESANRLSTPVQYEETRQHLPYFAACIKESMRLKPSAPSLFGRLLPPEGKVIDGVFVPGGTEVTSHSYTVHRDKALFGEDAEEFRPERWLEGEEGKAHEMEGGLFSWGMGYRVCLGKDIATMELFKVLPEVSVRTLFRGCWPG